MRYLLAFVAFFVTQFALSIEAQQDPKAWLNTLSTSPPGPYRAIRPVKIGYSLSWKRSVNAGKMEVLLTKPNPAVFHAEAKGSSTGLARALFPYSFSGSAQTNVQTLKPIAFNFQDKMKKQSHSYSIAFQPNQLVSLTKLTDRKTGKTTPYRNIFKFEKDVGMDLMSSILYLRSQPLTKGQKFNLAIATFNKPYLTKFTVLGKEKRTVQKKKYDTIKLNLEIQRIHTNMTTSPYQKIEKAAVWITDDSYRLPLEFQGDIFVGYIAARMTNRKWL